jgi:type IV secretion system protein VirD4
LRPFLSPKYDLKKHPNYGQTAEADKERNAFDAAKLITRRTALDPNEQYTVYNVTVPDEEPGEGEDTDTDEDILDYDDLDDPDAYE